MRSVLVLRGCERLAQRLLDVSCRDHPSRRICKRRVEGL